MNTLIFYIDIRNRNDSLSEYREFETRDDMLSEISYLRLVDKFRKDYSFIHVSYGEKPIDLDKNCLFDNELKTKLNDLIDNIGIKNTSSKLGVTRQFMWLLRNNRVHYIKKTLASKIKGDKK